MTLYVVESYSSTKPSIKSANAELVNGNETEKKKIKRYSSKN